jgi:hypothetical protein
MNWESWRSAFFGNLIQIAIISIGILMIGGTSQFSAPLLTWVVILFLFGTFGKVGTNELKRDPRDIYLIWKKCLFLSCILIFVSIYIFYKPKPFINMPIGIMGCIFLITLAAPFPIALYLNRNAKRFNLESTIADAN